MECLNEGLTREVILGKIDAYLHGELSYDDDRQFTEHILECEYCQETLLLVKMMLRVGKEYEHEIFKGSTAAENVRTQTIPDTPQMREEERFIAQPPFTLLKDNKPFHEILVTTPRFSWTKELEPPAVYTLLDQKGKTLIQAKVLGSLTGTLYSPPRPQTKVFSIRMEDGVEGREIIISLEEKEDRVMLRLETKKK